MGVILLLNENDLLNIIKKVAIEAVEASKPTEICNGKVINTSPLRISVEQKMTLGIAQIVLPQSITKESELAVSDEVVLIRQQGGQKYIVLDKLVKK